MRKGAVASSLLIASAVGVAAGDYFVDPGERLSSPEHSIPRLEALPAVTPSAAEAQQVLGEAGQRVGKYIFKVAAEGDKPKIQVTLGEPDVDQSAEVDIMGGKDFGNTPEYTLEAHRDTNGVITNVSMNNLGGPLHNFINFVSLSAIPADPDHKSQKWSGDMDKNGQKMKYDIHDPAHNNPVEAEKIARQARETLSAAQLAAMTLEKIAKEQAAESSLARFQKLTTEQAQSRFARLQKLMGDYVFSFSKSDESKVMQVGKPYSDKGGVVSNEVFIYDTNGDTILIEATKQPRKGVRKPRYSDVNVSVLAEDGDKTKADADIASYRQPDGSVTYDGSGDTPFGRNIPASTQGRRASAAYDTMKSIFDRARAIVPVKK